MNQKAVSITLFGRVQRVGFRYFVYRLAAELGINGFVRNEPGVGVYIEAEGEAHTLDVFIEHCKTGPPHADVTKCIVNPMPVQDFNGFVVR
ncbi:MAG: acylphosphatase [Bacteroidales bacterium]|nr:acylphosphatase [Bacteroidales bacterium]MDD4671681.1 acylphosphatase [Bacteroidales bacterium]